MIPSPPVDNAGGFFTYQYSNNTDTHKGRLHVRPFDPTTGNYTTVVPSGETNIQGTFSAFAAVLGALYPTSWVFNMKAVYQMAGTKATQVFGLTLPAAVTATGTGTYTTTLERATQETYNFTSNRGARCKVILLGRPQALEQNGPIVVTPTYGGAPLQAIVTFMSGASGATPTHGAVARDGSLCLPSAKLTITINRRLRRHYHFD